MVIPWKLRNPANILASPSQRTLPGRTYLQRCWKGEHDAWFPQEEFQGLHHPSQEGNIHSMVRPAMEYASTVLDPVSQKHIQLLEQVQRRTARYVFNNYCNCTLGCVTQLVKDLHWETLEERRRSGQLCMLYRITNNFVDIDPSIYC